MTEESRPISGRDLTLVSPPGSVRNPKQRPKNNSKEKWEKKERKIFIIDCLYQREEREFPVAQPGDEELIL